VEHSPVVTPLVGQTRPRPFAVALALVWIGVWVGALDVVANTVGLFTMTWVLLRTGRGGELRRDRVRLPRLGGHRPGQPGR
jgi:hypothetical protein